MEKSTEWICCCHFSASDILAEERQLSQDLVQSSKKHQEFRSIFQHVQAPQSQRSPSELFAQHIVAIVHHIKGESYVSALHFPRFYNLYNFCRDTIKWVKFFCILLQLLMFATWWGNNKIPYLMYGDMYLIGISNNSSALCLKMYSGHFKHLTVYANPDTMYCDRIVLELIGLILL